jgi:hypothetical protein
MSSILMCVCVCGCGVWVILMLTCVGGWVALVVEPLLLGNGYFVCLW